MRARWIATSVLALAAAFAAGVALGPRAAVEAQIPMPPAERSPALAGLGDGTAVYVDSAGRLFHLHAAGRDLALDRVYELRHDRQRHAREPDGRAPHGWYLDDLGAAGLAALERAKAGFAAETRSGAVDAAANARAERWARAVLDAGDATFLLEALRSSHYGTRRAAAFALGAAGYPETRPMLEEVLQEKVGDGAERARRLLEKLPDR